MTRALTRTNFNRSRLIQILADLAILDAVEPGNTFAEKLGLWVDFIKASALSAALNAISASPIAAKFPAQAATQPSIADDLAGTRSVLVNSINKSLTDQAASTRTELSSEKPAVPFDVAAAYRPYRRIYLAHQREMDLAIRALRAKVRDVLAKSSAALKNLALLDASLDNILRDRESKLLSTLASLLESRFAQLHQAHQQKLADAQQADQRSEWMRPGGWLAGFGAELQSVMLAELELRLQPTVGLIEAFNNITEQA